MYNYVSIDFFTITICHHATQHTLGQGQWDLQEWADRNPMKVSKCKCQGGQGPWDGTGGGKRGLEVVMGSELDTSLWCVRGPRQPAEFWLHEQGRGPQTEGRDCPPALGAPQSTTRDSVQAWVQHSKHLDKLGGAWGGPSWWLAWSTCSLGRGWGSWAGSA